MTRQPITKHGRDHRPPGTLGPDDPGGHDPIPSSFPEGILYGYGSVDLAVTNPGGLLLRYQMGEATGDLVDTSGYPSGPHNATLTEFTGGSDPDGGAHSTWDGSQAPTRAVVDHPAFGTADDGCVEFNYDQLHAPAGPFGNLGDWASITYPGAYFQNSWSLPVATTLKSISVFFKAAGSRHTFGPIIGAGIDYTIGWSGWCIGLDTSGALTFTGGNGPASSSDPVFQFGPAGDLSANQWYHCVVTNDGSNNWTMYLNGVVVATYTSTYTPSGGDIWVGGGPVYGNVDYPGTAYGFFLGQIDEIDCYDVTLTLDQVQAIYAARDAGEGTGVSTITIGAGDSLTPGAISSQLSDGTDAPDGQILTADGTGGSEWADAPTARVIEVYANGV